MIFIACYAIDKTMTAITIIEIFHAIFISPYNEATKQNYLVI